MVHDLRHRQLRSWSDDERGLVQRTPLFLEQSPCLDGRYAVQLNSRIRHVKSIRRNDQQEIIVADSHVQPMKRQHIASWPHRRSRAVKFDVLAIQRCTRTPRDARPGVPGQVRSRVAATDLDAVQKNRNAVLVLQSQPRKGQDGRIGDVELDTHPNRGVAFEHLFAQIGDDNALVVLTTEPQRRHALEPTGIVEIRLSPTISYGIVNGHEVAHRGRRKDQITALQLGCTLCCRRKLPTVQARVAASTV